MKAALAFDMICEMTCGGRLYTTTRRVWWRQKLVDRGSGNGIMARDYDTMISLSPHVRMAVVLDVLTRNYLAAAAESATGWNIQDYKYRAGELTSQTAGDKEVTMLEAMMLVRIPPSSKTVN